MTRFRREPAHRKLACGDGFHVVGIGGHTFVFRLLAQDHSVPFHRLIQAGFEFVHVAIDDASRLACAEILTDESGAADATFLRAAVRWFAKLDIRVERVMTDNGSGYVSNAFRDTCAELDLRHKRIRPYRPKTNGKVARLIQTLLREWAFRFVYSTSGRARSLAHAVSPLLQRAPSSLSSQLQSTH